MLKNYFHEGINLGGWLSQYDCNEEKPFTEQERSEHFKSFITKENIKQIAGWGLDHVRLPIDVCVLEDADNYHVIRPEALWYIDECIRWCSEYRLNIIIDLHNAAGVVYNQMDSPIPLLTDESLQERFIHIWEEIAKHLLNVKYPIIMFDLLNEISDSTGYLWNRLYEKTISRIREIDKNRFILVGSNNQNNVNTLKQLKLLDDTNVFYNFHFYDPQVFTHQKAHFSEEMKLYNRTVSYPDDISAFTSFLLEHREYMPKYMHVAVENRNDFNLMEKLLKDARDFVTYSGHELYCGEFGVINTAPPLDAVKWINDFRMLLNSYGIGHALWNYKVNDFGFIDKNNQIISDTMVRGVFGDRCLAK